MRNQGFIHIWPNTTISTHIKFASPYFEYRYEIPQQEIYIETIELGKTFEAFGRVYHVSRPNHGK